MSLIGYLSFSIDHRGVYYVFILFEEALFEKYGPFDSPYLSITSIPINFWENPQTDA